MAEAETNVQTLSLSTDYQVTEQLKLDASVVYNYAEYSWDWNFSDRITMLKTDNVSPLGMYNTEDQNNLIDTYSDLTYEEIKVTVGGTYSFTDALYASASVTYSDFDAEEEYVYGDESGSAVYSYLGVGYRF